LILNPLVVGGSEVIVLSPFVVAFGTVLPARMVHEVSRI
jgi:hypothetical protein